MSAEQIAELAEATRGLSHSLDQPTGKIDNEYERRTYEVLIRRGVPAAEARSKADWWARLKATDPSGETVIGPADNPVAKLDQPRIETDPITGRQTYKGSFQPQAASLGGSSSPVGSPPIMLEYSRNNWIGMQTPVNRFSLNPGSEYYATIPGTPPTMFAAGDLPIITGSGVDPSVLRWVAWPLRTTAAFTESRSSVAQLIELSLDGDPETYYELVSDAGTAAMRAYWDRITGWVSTPEQPGPLTAEDYAQLYNDGNGPE
jgi:hypothetical protein